MRKTRRRGRAGSSPRRSSLTAGAVACAVSIGAGRAPATRPPPPRPPIQIPKTTQRRSRAGSNPIRSSPNGGAAAWTAFPLAAAEERLVRPACARRYRSPRARHQRSSQLLLLPAAPLPRSRGRSGDSRSSAYLVGVVGVAAHRTSDAGAPYASHGSRQRSARCKTELYAAVLSFMLRGCHHCRESKRPQQNASATRGLAKVQV